MQIFTSYYNISFCSKTPKVSKEKVLDLLNKGLKDQEIAEIVGLKRRRICAIRNELEEFTSKSKTLTNEKLAELVSQGYTDGEIANMYNMTRQTIINRRKKAGIITQFTKKKVSEHEIERLKQEGYTNAEIADKLGVTKKCIDRNVNMIEGHGTQPRKFVDYSKFDFYYIKTLIEEGNSLQQIANFYKEKVGTIRKVLNKFNLKTIQASLVDSIKDEELLAAQKEGKSQKEIAKMFNISYAGALTPRLKKIGISKITQAKVNSIPDEKIKEMYYKGLSNQAIADYFNVSHQYIRERINALNLI